MGIRENATPFSNDFQVDEKGLLAFSGVNELVKKVLKNSIVLCALLNEDSIEML